jgi:hypothetical protein
LSALRPLLHRIDPAKRTAGQRNLTEWADGYDALICYRNVTQLTVGVSPGGPTRSSALQLPMYGVGEVTIAAR